MGGGGLPHHCVSHRPTRLPTNPNKKDRNTYKYLCFHYQLLYVEHLCLLSYASLCFQFQEWIEVNEGGSLLESLYKALDEVRFIKKKYMQVPPGGIII